MALGVGVDGPTFSPQKGSHAFKEMAEARKAKGVDPRELIGLGLLRPKGHNRNSDELRLGIYIQKKKLADHPIVDNLQTLAKGECKVIYTGPAIRRGGVADYMVRPVCVGCSIGHHRVTAGTVGAFAVNRAGGGVGILSNNHILADTNKGRAGDLILQPAKYDGGKKGEPAHHVGTLHKFVTIDFTPGTINLVDCAFAYLMDGVPRECRKFSDPAASDNSWEIDTNPTEVFPDDEVKKVGQTTGLTNGIVDAVEVDNIAVNLLLGRPNKIARFDRQIAISGRTAAFSKGGDSGALVMSKDDRPVGLLFAGTERGSGLEGVTYANPIETVLNALDIELYFGR
ncbi:MAG: hypothetical protein ACLPN5_19815 [Roseiarcus sp.]